MGTGLIDLLLIAVASGTLSLTLTASHITKTLRHEYLDAPYMMGELINCPYCMAHWTALIAAWWYTPVVAWDSYTLAQFVVNWLTITGLSVIYIGIAQRLLLFRESENEELREIIREARETINELLTKDGR